MKKFKRVLSLIMVLVMTSSLLSSCSSCENFSFEDDETQVNVVDNGNVSDGNDDSGNRIVTRGEWAVALGNQFGLDACQNLEPYFDDVDASSPYFVYVQAGVEWQIYSGDEDEFKPNEEATKEFILETSMRAAEVIEMKPYEVPEDGEEDVIPEIEMTEITEDELVDLVKDTPLDNVSSKELKDNASADYATQVLTWAVDEYQNKTNEEYNNVVVNKDVVSMLDTKVNSDGSFTVNETDLKVGDVIITAPEDDNISGVARKVTSIEKDVNGNYVVETTEPEIGEVFDDIEFAQIATVGSVDDIIPEEGVSVSIEDGEYIEIINREKSKFSTLSTNVNSSVITLDNEKKSKTLGFHVSYESKNGVKTVSGGLSEDSISIDGWAKFGEEEKEAFEQTGATSLQDAKKGVNKIGFKTKGKFEKGYKVTGEVKLENFFVEAEYTTKKLFGVPYGIKTLQIKVNYDVVKSIEIEGFLEEELKLASVPIAFGGGATLTLDVYLKGELNGKFAIETRISHLTKLNYTDGSGFKKTQDTTNEKTFKLGGSAALGIKGQLTLKFAGIQVVDVQLEVCVEVEIEGSITRVMTDEGGKIYAYEEEHIESGECTPKNIICFDGSYAIPVVTLKIGYSPKSLANKFGIKFSWKIFAKSGGTFKSHVGELHYEVGKGWCVDCTCSDLEFYDNEDETTTEQETTSEQETTTSSSILGGGMLTISAYALWLDVGEKDSITVKSIPDGYSENDIVWEIDDSSVATISTKSGSKCTIQGTGGGVAYVTISTADGAYKSTCAITVNDDGNISFDPL